MKKFSFSLQKLLNYKEQLFDIERNVLSDMRAILATLQVELAKLEQEHRDRADEFNRRASSGFTASEMELHKMYLRLVDHSIEQKQMQINMQRQAIDKQMDKVREAKIELSTIEKLREKKLEEYNYQEMKHNEQFIEEFVSNTKAAALNVG